MDSITILDKALCTGCGMCSNICPVNAIIMKTSDEGFLYPSVEDNCINCGKCTKTCPQLTNKNFYATPSVVHAIQANDEYRERCSSGGIFLLLAKKILSEKGVVFGATFDEEFQTVKHIGITNEFELPLILKSKYVQSDVGNTYKEAKAYLAEGRKVLFCGCPCQVEALKHFVSRESENLYTIDIICHGVPSPLVYKKFLNEMTPTGNKVIGFDFRDKKYGWGSLISASFDNAETKYEYYNGTYFRAFLSGLSMRKSCYHCDYSSMKRVGDITIGDFWGVKEVDSSFDDKKGTSLVFCNTEKGQCLLKSVSSECKLYKDVNSSKVEEISKHTNGALIRPTSKPQYRDCFFKHLNFDSVTTALKYAETSLIDVGIVGWWIETARSNYGSTLTCFALYRFIQSLGYSVAMISPPGFDRENAGDFNKGERYRMTANYSMDKMSENNKYIDTFVVGSDVLWYYNAFIDKQYMHMLDFVDSSKKKISYSTSFGNIKGFIPVSEQPKARRYLHRFDAVSVREFEGVDLCEEKFDVKATQVLDPVFICPMEEWSELSKKAERKIEKDYIFAYILDPSEKIVNTLKTISKKKDLPVVVITDKQTDREKKEEILKDFNVISSATPYEFIYHIKNANFVLTDSYHGLCFSIVFKRNFAALVNCVRGASRFETLASLFPIKEHYFYDANLVCDKGLKNVDYSIFEDTLQKEIVRSSEWLSDALKSPKKERKNATDIDILYEKIEQLEKRISVLEKSV